MRISTLRISLRVSTVAVLTTVSVFLQIPVAFAQSTAVSGKNSDTLEIRSGASPKKSITPAASSSSSALSDTTSRKPTSTKKPSKEEVLGISLEELLDLPIETVLEYARVLDSLQALQTSSRLGTRASGAKKHSSGTAKNADKSMDTKTIDKLNATLQHLHSHRVVGKSSTDSTGSTTGSRLTREEILRMKLKDLMDMRLGEILRLVNPTMASSATTSGHGSKRR